MSSRSSSKKTLTNRNKKLKEQEEKKQESCSLLISQEDMKNINATLGLIKLKAIYVNNKLGTYEEIEVTPQKIVEFVGFQKGGGRDELIFSTLKQKGHNQAEVCEIPETELYNLRDRFDEEYNEEIRKNYVQKKFKQLSRNK